jgi:hypothetical protein
LNWGAFNQLAFDHPIGRPDVYDHPMSRHVVYDHPIGRPDVCDRLEADDMYDRLEADGMYDLSMDRLLSTWFVQMNMGTCMGTGMGMDMAV